MALETFGLIYSQRIRELLQDSFTGTQYMSMADIPRLQFHIQLYMLLHPKEGSITFIAQDPCHASASGGAAGVAGDTIRQGVLWRFYLIPDPFS